MRVWNNEGKGMDECKYYWGLNLCLLAKELKMNAEKYFVLSCGEWKAYNSVEITSGKVRDKKGSFVYGCACVHQIFTVRMTEGNVEKRRLCVWVWMKENIKKMIIMTCGACWKYMELGRGARSSYEFPMIEWSMYQHKQRNEQEVCDWHWRWGVLRFPGSLCLGDFEMKYLYR